MEKRNSVACLAASMIISGLFLVSAAFAVPTEQDCINGGGYVTEKPGCRFCVGGKYDLAVVRGGAAKDSAPRSEGPKKNGEKGDPKTEKSGEK